MDLFGADETAVAEEAVIVQVASAALFAVEAEFAVVVARPAATADVAVVKGMALYGAGDVEPLFHSQVFLVSLHF